jgi:hypothetical protein
MRIFPAPATAISVAGALAESADQQTGEDRRDRVRRDVGKPVSGGDRHPDGEHQEERPNELGGELAREGAARRGPG